MRAALREIAFVFLCAFALYGLLKGVNLYVPVAPIWHTFGSIAMMFYWNRLYTWFRSQP